MNPQLAPGVRVKMVGLMKDDPDPVAVGTIGTVTHFNSVTEQIFVDWDDGRSLILLEEDPYVILNSPILFTSKPCPVCRQSSELELSLEEAEKLAQGTFAQEALPTRSEDFRELIITGTHAACWDFLFGGEEE